MLVGAVIAAVPSISKKKIPNIFNITKHYTNYQADLKGFWGFGVLGFWGFLPKLFKLSCRFRTVLPRRHDWNL